MSQLVHSPSPNGGLPILAKRRGTASPHRKARILSTLLVALSMMTTIQAESSIDTGGNSLAVRSVFFWLVSSVRHRFSPFLSPVSLWSRHAFLRPWF